MRAKKRLGQHFLTDKQVIDSIIELIRTHCPNEFPLVEVGPGQGVLTLALIDIFSQFKAIEFDKDMVAYLEQRMDPNKIIQADFIKLNLREDLKFESYNLVGNFPYNISSQIIFKMLENVAHIPVMIGMFQKEVADRICATPGGKQNGILSLNTQVFYNCKKMFDIGPEAFSPPPRVNSSIIFLERKKNIDLPCQIENYSKIIKMAFSQRRKKMRNTLKGMFENTESEIFHKRPEQLSVEEFVNITVEFENQNKDKL